jgi:hypothetical protein
MPAPNSRVRLSRVHVHPGRVECPYHPANSADSNMEGYRYILCCTPSNGTQGSGPGPTAASIKRLGRRPHELWVRKHYPDSDRIPVVYITTQTAKRDTGHLILSSARRVVPIDGRERRSEHDDFTDSHGTAGTDRR